MRFLFRKIVLLCLLVLFIKAEPLDDRYHTFLEIENFLDSLTQVFDFNSEFKVYQIGSTSLEELPIYAVKISDNVEFKEDEPRVLIVGQVHAEEVLGVEAVLELILLMLDPPPEQVQHMNILKQNVVTTIRRQNVRRRESITNPLFLKASGVMLMKQSVCSTVLVVWWRIIQQLPVGRSPSNYGSASLLICSARGTGLLRGG